MNTKSFKQHNPRLQVAMWVALGMVSSVGYAADYTLNSAMTYALEQKADTMELAIPQGTDTFNIPVDKGRIIRATTETTTTIPYYVKIVLSNGATFVNEPSLMCECEDTDANDCNIRREFNAAGSNKVSFEITASDANAADLPVKMLGGTCRLDGDGGQLKIKVQSGTSDYSMQIVTIQDRAVDMLSAINAGIYASFSQAMEVKPSAGRVTIDVSNPSLSTDFIADGTVYGVGTPAVKIAMLGYIQYANKGSILNTKDATVANAEDTLSKFNLTVSGIPLESANTKEGVRAGGVFLAPYQYDDAGTPKPLNCSVSAKENTWAQTNAGIVSAVGGTVTFEGIDAALFVPTDGAATDQANGVAICFQSNGTTAISKGKVKFKLTGTGASNPSSTPNLDVVDTVLTDVLKNGASVKVLNLPGDPNGGDQPFVRIYNMESSRAARVTATLYDQNGVKIGNSATQAVTLVDKLDAGAVKALSLKDLFTAFGVTSWSGRAWMQLEADTQKLRVQALVRSGGAGGTLINLSDRVMADSECLSRSDTKGASDCK
jgi:hypothetical protein